MSEQQAIEVQVGQVWAEECGNEWKVLSIENGRAAVELTKAVTHHFMVGHLSTWGIGPIRNSCRLISPVSAPQATPVKPPEGYVKCSKNCGRWTSNPYGAAPKAVLCNHCATDGDEHRLAAYERADNYGPDWTEPADVPAAPVPDRSRCKVEIPLGHGRVAIIDEEDREAVEQHAWHSHTDARRKTCYARTDVVKDGVRSAPLLHKFLWELWGLPEVELDHEDGNGLNCTRENLREATHGQNMANRPVSRANRSGYKGVTWHAKTKKWRAVIVKDGKYHSLGLHETPELARDAYNAAAQAMNGPFARVPPLPEAPKAETGKPHDPRCVLDADHKGECKWVGMKATPTKLNDRDFDLCKCGFSRAAHEGKVPHSGGMCDRFDRAGICKPAPIATPAKQEMKGPVCIRCRKNEAPALTALLELDGRPLEWCGPCVGEARAWAAMQTGKPYAGPVRLPRPRMARDEGVESDCWEDVR